MVFYGRGLVWNPNKNCAYRFSEGVFETTETEAIAFLKAQGYKHDGAEEGAANMATEEPAAATKPSAKKTSKKGQA